MTTVVLCSSHSATYPKRSHKKSLLFKNLDVLIYFAIHTFSISEKAGTEHTSRCPVPALLIQSKDTTASATAFLISSRFMVIYLLESAVHKGEGPAWRVRGLTADVRPIHRPYGRSPFPFREGQNNISFCVPLQEGQLWYNGSKFDQ